MDRAARLGRSANSLDNSTALRPVRRSRGPPMKHESVGMRLRRRVQGDRGLGGEVEEGEGLLQVQADVRVGVTQIADGRVLADVEIEIATACGDDESAVNGGCPDDFAFDESLDVFENGVAVVAGFGELRVSVGAEENRIRAIDTDQSQLAQRLSDGCGILAYIGRQRPFGIAGALADANDSGSVVAFEDGAVFCKG